MEEAVVEWQSLVGRTVESWQFCSVWWSGARWRSGDEREERRMQEEGTAAVVQEVEAYVSLCVVCECLRAWK